MKTKWPVVNSIEIQCKRENCSEYFAKRSCFQTNAKYYFYRYYKTVNLEHTKEIAELVSVSNYNNERLETTLRNHMKIWQKNN